MLGYFLSHREEIPGKWLLWGAPIFLLTVAVCLYMTNYLIETKGSGTYYSAFRVYQVAYLFCLFRKALENRKMNRVLQSAVVSLGSCTFGIYLLEQFLREQKDNRALFTQMCGVMPTFSACLLFILIVVLEGWLITRALKKIPGIKKLL